MSFYEIVTNYSEAMLRYRHALRNGLAAANRTPIQTVYGVAYADMYGVYNAIVFRQEKSALDMQQGLEYGMGISARTYSFDDDSSDSVFPSEKYGHER